jgi:hypothetical protein
VDAVGALRPLKLGQRFDDVAALNERSQQRMVALGVEVAHEDDGPLHGGEEFDDVAELGVAVFRAVEVGDDEREGHAIEGGAGEDVVAESVGESLLHRDALPVVDGPVGEQGVAGVVAGEANFARGVEPVAMKE